MSKSNASAKTRRAYNGQPPPSSMQPAANPSQNNNSPTNIGSFTLQQIIAMIDNRLINLESFMKESKEKGGKQVHFDNAVASSPPLIDNSITTILNEFNDRFDMIVNEVNVLKDIVIKLQSYTMDVNKTLLEERIQIFSELGNAPTSSVNCELDTTIQGLSDSVNEQMITYELDGATSVDLKDLVKEEFANSSSN
jgi:hypothetical protein